MTIYFYSTQGEYGCFSNFSKHGFELDGLYWPTSEHYFQAQKFVGLSYLEEIRAAKTPKQAASLGRSRAQPLRADWETVKDDIMRRGVLCKFQTHADIRQTLLNTGDVEIVENAPGDYYWGCGKTGTGKNMLGIILMETRASLSRIYHITSQGAWQAAQADGRYQGDTLASQGFIHFSNESQVVRVANAVFKGQTDLVLLKVDPTSLTEKLCYEGSISPEGQPENFPHLYGPLNLTSVIQVFDFSPNPDGLFSLPKG